MEWYVIYVVFVVSSVGRPQAPRSPNLFVDLFSFMIPCIPSTCLVVTPPLNMSRVLPRRSTHFSVVCAELLKEQDVKQKRACSFGVDLNLEVAVLHPETYKEFISPEVFQQVSDITQKGHEAVDLLGLLSCPFSSSSRNAPSRKRSRSRTHGSLMCLFNSRFHCCFSDSSTKLVQLPRRGKVRF